MDDNIYISVPDARLRADCYGVKAKSLLISYPRIKAVSVIAYGFMIERPKGTGIILKLSNGWLILGRLTRRGIYISAKEFDSKMEINPGCFYEFGVKRITIIDIPME